MNYYELYAGASWVPPFFKFAGAATPRVLAWRAVLYDLLFSAWEIELPENWDYTPFRYALFGAGSVGIVYTNSRGWVYGFYGVEKCDWQYVPVKFNVTLNATDGTTGPFPGIRGINGAVLHVRDDFMGYGLLIDQYAEMLATCDQGVENSVTLAASGKLLPVESKKDADELRQAILKAKGGEPITYINKKLFDADGNLRTASLLGDLGREYYGDKIMETRLMILKDFLTRVGVRTVGMEKREHLLNQEIAENNDETGAAPYIVSTSLEKDLRLLNEMGCKISIKPRYDYSGAGIEEGGEPNVSTTYTESE